MYWVKWEVESIEKKSVLKKQKKKEQFFVDNFRSILIEIKTKERFKT